jgi:uncharacterized membrane protein
LAAAAQLQIMAQIPFLVLLRQLVVARPVDRDRVADCLMEFLVAPAVVVPHIPVVGLVPLAREFLVRVTVVETALLPMVAVVVAVLALLD